MKQIYSLVLLLASLSITVNSFSQADNDCDTIYRFVEIMPEYENGKKGLMNYLNKELIPILANCNNRDTTLIASMHLTLTINKAGQVIDVKFNKINSAGLCKNELRQKLMTMSKWRSGKQGGEPVCCNYSWPISCILWK